MNPCRQERGFYNELGSCRIITLSIRLYELNPAFVSSKWITSFTTRKNVFAIE
ncbi:MAG TPA: hypothetical protein VLA68_06210 [Nitrososphaera sp.]|nr:hypothetical protein [Nitrososphaera sp.]